MTFPHYDKKPKDTMSQKVDLAAGVILDYKTL